MAARLTTVVALLLTAAVHCAVAAPVQDLDVISSPDSLRDDQRDEILLREVLVSKSIFRIWESFRLMEKCSNTSNAYFWSFSRE